jgi:hypothetical protein
MGKGPRIYGLEMAVLVMLQQIMLRMPRADPSSRAWSTATSFQTPPVPVEAKRTVPVGRRG